MRVARMSKTRHRQTLFKAERAPGLRKNKTASCGHRRKSECKLDMSPTANGVTGNGVVGTEHTRAHVRDEHTQNCIKRFGTLLTTINVIVGPQPGRAVHKEILDMNLNCTKR
jgi:hypothetical protein